MLLLRVLTTGVCVACVVMLATIHPVRIEVVARAEAPAAAAALPAPLAAVIRDHTPRLSVVDVGAGVAPSALATLVGLRSYERVSAVNDQPVDEDLDAELLIRSMARPGGFLDLTVSGAATERRVLVLMH
jgi:hypothetical protein